MARWGVVTWIFVLALVLMLLIYYKGANSLATTGSSAFGKTIGTLTGTSGGKPLSYAT